MLRPLCDASDFIRVFRFTSKCAFSIKLAISNLLLTTMLNTPPKMQNLQCLVVKSKLKRQQSSREFKNHFITEQQKDSNQLQLEGK